MDENEVIEPAAENTEVIETQPEEKKFDRKEAYAKAIEKLEAPVEAKEREVIEPVQLDPEDEPPAEFTSQEKEAYRSGNLKEVNKAIKRVNNSRRTELQRVQSERARESQEHRTWKELADTMKPYIEARGKEGVDPKSALMEALNLVNEIKTNPKAAKAAIDELTGGRLEELESEPNRTSAENSELRDLRTRFDSYIQGVETEKNVNYLDNLFENFKSHKTASGEPAFLDIQKFDESSIQLATKIGSLIRNPSFQEMVKVQTPDATDEHLFEAAYKYAGGRVLDTSVTSRHQSDKQKHIARSSRAAASTPGRSTSPNNSPKKFANRKDAIRAAMEDLQEH